ncbi:ParB/RepB/Spo0J family partition protein [Micromonospora sediminicola]|uniref:ParB/RepB/Spo0J family partition protein n=1 Tax=Micromonospora sediminicola TaxID=946078 RepID=UPI0037B7E644
MAGKRINLSELATEPSVPEARVPSFAESSPRTARVQQVAANPLNTRDLTSDHAKIASIADSMRLHGQLQPCTVVARKDFLRIFPEHEVAIGSATWVQVTGGRRRAAAVLAERPTLDIVVKPDLATSRESWVSATAAENLDRENLDPVEEAQAVQLLVKECGTGKAAAERLGRTAPWVTQRLNLLKLAPEVQALVRTGEVALREARDLHQLPAEEQLQALRRRQEPAEPELTAVNQADPPSTDDGKESTQRQRRSGFASAVRRLGGTPVKIAESLRAELPPTQLRELAELLLQSTDDPEDGRP